MKEKVKMSGLFDDGEFERVVIDWLEATANFYRYYQNLVNCIKERLNEHNLTENSTAYIGQCPVNQLLSLIKTMQRELGKLTRDMEQLDNLKRCVNKTGYKKMAVHTLTLNQLNQQAQTRLHLVTLSTV